MSAIGSRLRSPLVIAAVMAIVAAVTAALVIGTKMLMPRISNTRAMCAEFSDAVGLYPGNKVALLGIEVGSTTAIVNKPDHVEVDFT
ncbi:MAG: MlaD family protein, partial [Mycobacterium sp.]